MPVIYHCSNRCDATGLVGIFFMHSNRVIRSCFKNIPTLATALNETLFQMRRFHNKSKLHKTEMKRNKCSMKNVE